MVWAEQAVALTGSAEPCATAHGGGPAVEREEALPHIGRQASAGLAQDHGRGPAGEQGEPISRSSP